MNRLLERLIVLEAGEAPALLASFATLLCMFANYTIAGANCAPVKQSG